MRRVLVVVGLVLVLGAWGPCAPPVTSGGSPMAGPTTTGLAALVAGEDWHYVGGAGEPAFSSGWANYGSSHPRLAFRLREAGVVDLVGVVVASSASPNIFTLPVGYRPTSEAFFPIIKANPARIADLLYTDSTGVVAVTLTVTSSEFYFISGSFFLDTATP